MIANKAERIEELEEDASPAHPLPAKFEECWAVIEGGNNKYEHALRLRIEGATDKFLESSVCNYLRELVQNNSFFITSKGLAAKLLGDIARRWRHKDKSTKESADALLQCVLTLLKPYMECVPARMRLRVRVQLWQKPTLIPEHGTAPAFAVSVDAVTGEIHRRFYGTNRHPVPASPVIACGLTILCQPFRYGDEAYAQDNNQGGYLFSEEQTLGVIERNGRQVHSVSPKP